MKPKEKEVYRVVDCFNSHEINAVVNNHLNSGWILLEIREQHSEFFHVYSIHFGKKGFLFEVKVNGK
jgi:hypothetical protein